MNQLTFTSHANRRHAIHDFAVVSNVPFCQRKHFIFSYLTGLVKIFTHSCSWPIVSSYSLAIQTSALSGTNLPPKPWGYNCPINLPQNPKAAKFLSKSKRDSCLTQQLLFTLSEALFPKCVCAAAKWPTEDRFYWVTPTEEHISFMRLWSKRALYHISEW